MANIKVKLDYPIKDGTGFTFHAPCDCSKVEGVAVEHPGGTQNFIFKDAHGNALTDANNLFAAGSLVKIILDVTNSAALIQNADTNGYLEQRIRGVRTEIAAERARINQFTSLEEGSTTGDAELADLRVDCRGKRWENAGGAVRGITGELYNAFETSEGINLLNPVEVERHQNSELDWDEENDSWTSGYISVSAGDVLTVQYNDPTSSERKLGTIDYIQCYNSDKVKTHNVTVAATDVTIPDGCSYVKLTYTLPIEGSDVAVVKGTDILPFEEYWTPICKLKSEFLPDKVNTNGGGYGGIFGLSVTDDGMGNVTVDGGDEIPSVLFVEQELTEEQKAQARENIGAGTGGGASITVDSEPSHTSTNPVQNRVVTSAISSVTSVAVDARDAAAQAQSTANAAGMEANTVKQILENKVNPKIAALETQMGNVETALDSILAIQEGFIGGDSV